jgi:hypothetical protein
VKSGLVARVEPKVKPREDPNQTRRSKALQHETADGCPCLHLCALKDVRDALGVLLPAPYRGDAACVERLRDFPEGARARLLGVADDGKHVTSAFMAPTAFLRAWWSLGLRGTPHGPRRLKGPDGYVWR